MIPINSNGNCTTDLIGSGSRSCDIQSYGDVIGFALHPKGFSMDVSADTISEDTWSDEIKDFNVIPFLGIYDFTQDTPENETATSSTGIMSTIRVGKPQFTFSFDKGGCFHKALYDKRGKNRWDISLIFETGILMAVNQAQTEVSGFDMGLFDVGTFRLQQGTDPQQTTNMIQLIDANQFNTLFTFMTWDKLGVNLSKIDGVVETKISYTVDPSTATTFAVKVVGSCNNDDAIAGLDGGTNWRLGGEQTSATSITSVVYRPATDDYLFTVNPALVATDTVQPTLINGSFDVAEDALGGLYKGKAPLFTVA